MNTLKSLLMSCVMTALLWNVSEAEETMIVGFFNLEPHIYVGEHGVIQGAAVEYWEKYLAPEMHVTVKWEGPLSYLRLLDMLRNGEVDAGIILGKTPERVEFLDYPDEPFYYAMPTLVVKQDAPLKEIRSVEDMLTLTICYVNGGYLPPIMQDSRLKIENLGHSNWAEGNLKKLAADRCDAAFFPEMNTARYYAHKLGLQEQVRTLALPEEPSVFYTAFSKKSGKDWLARYQQARETINAQIIYETISERYASGNISLP